MAHLTSFASHLRSRTMCPGHSSDTRLELVAGLKGGRFCSRFEVYSRTWSPIRFDVGSLFVLFHMSPSTRSHHHLEPSRDSRHEHPLPSLSMCHFPQLALIDRRRRRINDVNHRQASGAQQQDTNNDKCHDSNPSFPEQCGNIGEQQCCSSSPFHPRRTA